MIIVKVGGEYLVDSNNNKAYIAYFGDEVKAEKALLSLVDCRDLVNCKECEGCIYCKDCVNCKGCVGLEGSSNEVGCVNSANYNKLRRGI